MIKVSGFAKKEYGGKFFVMSWNNGKLSGDESIIYAMTTLANNYKGIALYADDAVYDWLQNPINVGALISMLFDEDRLEITTDETITPPPCPEGAVC